MRTWVHPRLEPVPWLVVSRVNHCDLRGLERAALVGPAERCCPAVVVLYKGDDASCELLCGAGLAATEQPSFQDGKEQLDLYVDISATSSNVVFGALSMCLVQGSASEPVV